MDDDEDVRDVLDEVLTDAGFDVICVDNGQAALEYLRDAPAPDAILLDLVMPLMSGWELARHLRRQPALARVPLVLISGGESQAESGDEVLRKPLDLDRLLETLHAKLGGERAADPAGGSTRFSGARPS